MRAVLDVLEPAAAEALEAVAWYRDRSVVAAAAFQLEIRRAFSEVEGAPEAWPAYVEGTRRFVLQRFPYEVVYVVRGIVSLWSRLPTASGAQGTGGTGLANKPMKRTGWRSQLNAGTLARLGRPLWLGSNGLISTYRVLARSARSSGVWRAVRAAR